MVTTGILDLTRTSNEGYQLQPSRARSALSEPGPEQPPALHVHRIHPDAVDWERFLAEVARLLPGDRATDHGEYEKLERSITSFPGQSFDDRSGHNAKQPRELRCEVFYGLVKQIEGATATVLLEHKGQRQRRTMSTEELARNDIRFERQGFTIVVRELQRPNGRVSKTIDIDPVGDPTKRTIKSIRPGADFSKFKDMP